MTVFVTTRAALRDNHFMREGANHGSIQYSKMDNLPDLFLPDVNEALKKF